MKKRCIHYWNYEHAVYQGRKGENDNNVGVVRWCADCKKKEMAFTKGWIKQPKQYNLSDIGK